MANLKFPDAPPRAGRGAVMGPKVSLDVLPTQDNYPGAPRASDAAMLANVPELGRYPGDRMPGTPIERAPAAGAARLKQR